MKKIMAGLLAVSMVFGAGGVLGNMSNDVFTLTASADNEKPTTGKYGDNVTWTISEDDTLTISGEGDMYNVQTSALWYKKYDIKKIVIEKGVTSVGDSLFESHENLTSVSIADTVKRIGGYSFGLCENLTEINIPNSVTEIGAYAFTRCIGLTNITIPPDSVTSIEECAFLSCKGIKAVTIPASVENIGDHSFGYTVNSATREYEKYNGFTIIGYKGTAAEKYAEENGFKFIDLKKVGKKGDVNGDNEINVTDLAKTAAHIKGKKLLTDEQKFRADVNNDGNISVADISGIAANIKGKKML